MSRRSARRASQVARWLAYAHDIGMAGLVMAGALVWRYQFEPKALPIAMVWRATISFMIICAVIFPAFRLERSLWRYTALNDVVRIGRALILANLLLLPVLFLTDRLGDFPRTGVFIEAPCLLAVLVGVRLLVRTAHHGGLAAAFRIEDRSAPLAIIVGSPDAVASYLGELERGERERLRVAGVITSDIQAHRRMIAGAEVLGDLDDLAAVLATTSEARANRHGPGVRVVLADLRPGRALMELVVTAAAESGARVSRRRGPGSGLAQIEAADLLDRPPRRLDMGRAQTMITGKRVLVTGAGGTIGGELTRQIMAFRPAHVILVDASEYNLYAMDQSLIETRPEVSWTAQLGDVRDRTRMERLFQIHRPDLVLHAAALKHVPLMETHPAEAVQTNIGGARIIAELSAAYGAALVFISTDKAVNPTNVMGATKRVAEKVVRAICAASGNQVSVVRFGNVLGSAGSVVPLFERQIAEGGPVTVTDPNMVRYFMTVQEAASLVLQAAALPAGDDATVGASGVYVLDMGEPVKIEALARQLIRLHGLRPGNDIAIRYSGLRPGEKLYEEIFYDAEQVSATAADGVLATFDPAPGWEDLSPQIDDLLKAAACQDEAGALIRLHALEPAFTRIA